VPTIIGSLLQLINGVTFIGEGVMIGTGCFGALATGQVLATAALLLSLRYASSLTAVWLGFWVFNGAMPKCCTGPRAQRRGIPRRRIDLEPRGQHKNGLFLFQNGLALLFQSQLSPSRFFWTRQGTGSFPRKKRHE